VKTDGLLQAYQRGHKAVMNTHSVGGQSDYTKYIGMDEFGNKYYEDFNDLLRTHNNLFKIAIIEDGFNTMIIPMFEATTETLSLQNGTDGLHTSTMMLQYPTVTLSGILFTKDLIYTVFQAQLKCTPQKTQ
jgi:hypothetical protein